MRARFPVFRTPKHSAARFRQGQIVLAALIAAIVRPGIIVGISLAGHAVMDAVRPEWAATLRIVPFRRELSLYAYLPTAVFILSALAMIPGYGLARLAFRYGVAGLASTLVAALCLSAVYILVIIAAGSASAYFEPVSLMEFTNMLAVVGLPLCTMSVVFWVIAYWMQPAAYVPLS